MSNLSNEQKDILKMLKVFKKVCEGNNIWYSLACGSVLGAVRHKGFIPWDHDADVFILLSDREHFRAAFMNSFIKDISLRNFDITKRCGQCHDSLFMISNGKSIHLDIYTLVGAPSDYREQKRFIQTCYYLDRIFKSKFVNWHNCKPRNKFPVLLSKCITFPISESRIKENIHKRENLYPIDKADYLVNMCCYNTVKECIPKDIYTDTIEVQFEDESFMIPKRYEEYLSRIYGTDYMIPKKY